MNDALLVRVLNAVADLHKKVQAFLCVELVIVAVFVDRNTGHILHDEVRTSFGCCPCVEDFGDVAVIHQRQGLSLGLKSSQDLAGVHADFYELQSDPALNRLRLFREVDDAHAALAENRRKFVGTNHLPR